MIDVAIVGAGLAGLNCALELERAGLSVQVNEASDAPGGRLRTDLVEGFRLDRGFQVLLTAYPEAKSVLDYGALDLHNLKPGALVWHEGKFHRFADPFREPSAVLPMLFDGIVSFADKIRVARLRGVARKTAHTNFVGTDETTTGEFLRNFGFSDRIIDRFFRPFFGGVFLERELATSSRYFQFLFSMFAEGSAAVPALGMEEIPGSMARRLAPATLNLASRVTRIRMTDKGFVLSVDSQERVEARVLVLAAPTHEVDQIMAEAGLPVREVASVWNQTTTLYYAADRAPVEEPMLVLNGEGSAAGPVNNATVMSQVSEAYAPRGAHLVSASVVGVAPVETMALANLEQQVRAHLKLWFGKQVADWRMLRAYPISHAVPLQRTFASEGAPKVFADRVFICRGEHDAGSIQGALASGRLTGKAVHRLLKGV